MNSLQFYEKNKIKAFEYLDNKNSVSFWILLSKRKSLAQILNKTKQLDGCKMINSVQDIPSKKKGSTTTKNLPTNTTQNRFNDNVELLGRNKKKLLQPDYFFSNKSS